MSEILHDPVDVQIKAPIMRCSPDRGAEKPHHDQALATKKIPKGY
jgi:hypothetical protein